MDLYNNKMKDQFQEDEGCKQPSIDNIDSFTFQQIELLIQQQVNISFILLSTGRLHLRLFSNTSRTVLEKKFLDLIKKI